MTKVIKYTADKVVTVAECSKRYYYGIYCKTDDDSDGYNKGFITRSEYDDGCFVVMCACGFTNGNNFNSFRNHNDINALIHHLIDNKFTVYRFDTPKELFAWLAE